ncbi:MAG: serine/threonine protein kinase [Gemmatimonadales bacterium]|nr:serine/threonine protein kinase [Gemmatimonadales bacterium]
MMDETRWDRIQSLFHAALNRPPKERSAWLLNECGGDSALLDEVAHMLAADAQRDGLLEQDLAAVAASLVRREDHGTLAGRTFGPYRVLDLVGQGGMGVVYRAERRDVNQQVAIKVLRDAAVSPARRERFSVEQQTLARLNHPAIAQLYHADTLPDGTPWFALEFVDGRRLTEYCREQQSSVQERLLLIRAVAEAVEHAHRHLIVHRDLKPSNILVRDDGSVKLLDFGIAKHLEDLETPADQTRTGLRLMTPAYAAPEQLRGDPIGIHTDIYSLGVILYEVLAGRTPFDLAGKTPGEAERLVLERDPERPSLEARQHAWAAPAGRAAWSDLDVLCLTAMHKDAARRYRTIDALIKDIDRYLAGEPLAAQPDTIAYRIGKLLKRHRAAALAAAATLVTLIALMTFYTVQLSRAREAALAEATRTQRIQRFVFAMFRGGDETAGPADSLRVVTLLDRGLDEARTLDAEPRLQADLYHTLGGISHQLGQLERADSLLSLALERRRALLGADHADVAASELALGELRIEQARYDDADALVRPALALLERGRPSDDPTMTAARVALGKILQERGQYEESIAELTLSAASASPRRHEDPTYALAVTELGNSYFYAGQYGAADSLFRLLRDFHQARYGPRHPLVAGDLINIGAVAFEQGRHPDAEGTYREALSITEEFYGGNHPKVADGLTMLSRPLLFQHKTEEAWSILHRALAIQERVYGSDHPKVASVMNEVGNVAAHLGRLPESEKAYARVLRIYRGAYDSTHYTVGVAISNLAHVHLVSGQYEEAVPLFREAIAIFSERQSPQHTNTGIARIKLGRALQRLGRNAEAAVESRAGYEIMRAQVDPSSGWLRAVRIDLLAAHEALGDEEVASRYRAELADTAASPSTR